MTVDISSNATTTTSYSSAKRIKWETELLKKAEDYLLAERFSWPQALKKGEAGTVRFNKLLRPAKKTTASIEGILQTVTDAKKLVTNYIDVTPNTFEDSFVFTDDVGIEAFITDEQNQEEIAGQMARSLEYQIQKIIAQGGMRHRIDNDSNYIVASTVDSATSTTIVDAVLTQANDYWDGGYCTITNPEGPGYDETHFVANFTAADDTLDFTGDAWTNAPTTASKYRLVVGTGITSADLITTTGLIMVRRLHRHLGTEMFEGGTYRAFVNADQEADLWADTDWKATAQYDDSGRYKDYRLVRWMGIEFYIGSQLWRETVAGVEAEADGAVHIAPVFGRKAYSIFRWGMGSGEFGVKWYYKDQADSQDLTNRSKAISWKAKFAGKVLRSTSIVGLMTGATASNLLVK